MTPPSATAIAYPADYMVTEQDALGYVRECGVASVLLLGAYALTVQGLFSLPGLILLVGLILPRWIINVHELLHIYDTQQINRAIGLLGISPVPLSILSLSYSEIRALHFAHHRAPTSADDPDAYHIRGADGWVFLNALTAPEQSTLRWIATYGLSPSLAIDLGLKFIYLIALAAWGGSTFGWFWLSLRLVYGLGDFVFFRCVHHHNGVYGTFALSLPPYLTRLGTGLFGRTVVDATLNHDLHHTCPGLAARSLAQARSLNLAPLVD